MKHFIYIEGDRIKGCHYDLKQVLKWKKEGENKHKNVTIAEVIQ